jgi:uncharacterized protein DUF4058
MMRSPFPGMDPYLEQRWGDFHARLITYLSDALQPALPPNLRARMEERVYVESVDGAGKQFVPDVHVYQMPRGASGAAAGGGGVAVAEPIVVHVPAEVTERFIQIIDVRSGGRVVTVIEVLSPANKLPGRGRNEYLQKQREYIDGGVNLVEIDLLRIGQHTTLAKLGLIAPDKITTYHVNTFRAARPEFLEYFRMPLRERLPRLPIPLRPADRDVVLDLQAVVDTAYDRGRYDDIDYSRPLHPPLDPADQQWASQLPATRA